MFNEPPRERSFPTTAVGIASVAVVILVLVLVMLGHRHGSSSAANAAYGPNLAISNIQMSESTSLSGGKSTYIDGHIANHGPATVTGVTVQVLFANDTGSVVSRQGLHKADYTNGEFFGALRVGKHENAERGGAVGD